MPVHLYQCELAANEKLCLLRLGNTDCIPNVSPGLPIAMLQDVSIGGRALAEYIMPVTDTVYRIKVSDSFSVDQLASVLAAMNRDSQSSLWHSVQSHSLNIFSISSVIGHGHN